MKLFALASPYSSLARGIATSLAALLVHSAGAAAAQEQPASATQQQPAPVPQGSNVPPPAAAPVPSEMELARLIWSTMVTIDNANGSGNYTVLRDSSATGFQIANDPAKLAQIFAGLRASRIDLTTTLLTAPSSVSYTHLTLPTIYSV